MTAAPHFGVLHAPEHWRTVDFISDLHLKADEPGTFQAWAQYLRRTPADAVFILGDLFEVWVGDDGALPGSFEAQCGQVLRAASAACDLFFMPGNRDFLVGDAFLAHCGVARLDDPTVLAFEQQRLLLTHGDLLCTDDVAYQQFRQQVRSDRWQADFLGRPLVERQALARRMREHSEARHASEAVYAHTDDELARRWLRDADAGVLIHGHTHQPADHVLAHDPPGRPLRQLVLSDWHVAPGVRRAQVLRLDADGLRRLPPDAPDTP